MAVGGGERYRSIVCVITEATSLIPYICILVDEVIKGLLEQLRGGYFLWSKFKVDGGNPN
jgi:hypothetical protein